MKLSQGIVGDSIRRLDWSTLKAHLQQVDLDHETQRRLIGMVRRADALIIKHIDTARMSARDAFTEALMDHIGRRCGQKVERSLRRQLDVLRSIERVYHGILALVAKSDAAQMSASKRIASLISRCVVEHRDIMRRVHEKNASQQGKKPPTSFADDHEGNQVDSNAVREAMVAAIEGSVLMEAYIHGWYDDNGCVVLPTLPMSEVADDDRFRVGTTQLLAAGWWKWEDTERRARYCRGELKWYTGSRVPKWAPPMCVEAVDFKQNLRSEVVDLVANLRLKARIEQVFYQMLTQTNLAARAQGIDVDVQLWPDGMVSVEEGHAAEALDSALSYDLINDREKIKGLRLIEWLRGYAALQAYVLSRVDEAHYATDVLVVTQAELISLLQRLGLPGDLAQHFIDAVTFSKSSRDLYDSPLLKQDGNTYVIFSPVLTYLSIARALLSAVSMHGAKLRPKGSGFEARVRDLIARHGHNVRHFKTRRGEEEFEVDAMFVWGEWAFLLECKNRTLSGNHPVQTYYFELETQEHAAQVKRLLAGLSKYPDILVEHCPESIGKKIVACVINGPPFSLPEGIDGVYMTDFSALHRFFEDPHLCETKLPVATSADRVAYRSVITSLWKSEAGPTPEDLIELMRMTPQFVLIAGHLSPSYSWIVYKDDALVRVRGSLQRDVTLESAREVIAKFRRE